MTRFRQSAILPVLCGLALASQPVRAATPYGPPVQFTPLAQGGGTFWIPEAQGMWMLGVSSPGVPAWQWVCVNNLPASFAPRSLVARAPGPSPVHVKPDGSASMFVETPLGCCPSIYSWQAMFITGTPAAAGPVVADPERNRALMVGPLGEVSVLTFGPITSQGAWTTLPVAAPLLVPQFDAAIAVDSARDQLILAGGMSPCPFGQFPATSAWTMPLGGPYQWSPLPSVPFGGSESDLVVDPAYDRLLWVGGHSIFDCGGGPTEAWNTNVYGLSLLTPNPAWANVGSMPVEPAASAYLDGSGLFIFGGTEVGPGFLANVESRAVFQASPAPSLTFGPSAWGAPHSRAGAQIAYHEGIDVLIHEGGSGPFSEYGDYGTFQDLWAWEGSAPGWVLHGTGPSLAYAATIADNGGDFILFGGYSDSPAPLQNPVLSNETWRLSATINTYEEISATPGPTARQNSAAAYDPATDRMLIYGGQDAGGLRTDLWSLDLQTSVWSEEHPAGFTPPAAPAALTWDGPRNRLLLAAESSPGTVVVWSANAALTTWTQLPTPGAGPAHAHSIAVDPSQPWLAVLDDSLKVWKLPFDSPHQWELISRTPRPLGKGRLFFRNARGLVVYDSPPQIFDVDARGTVGVPDALPPPRLALRIAGANPSRVPRVELSLPGGTRARLELFDLAGRRVWSRDVTGLGIGVHTVAIGDPSLAAGVYGVRLVHGGEQRTAKLVVLP